MWPLALWLAATPGSKEIATYAQVFRISTEAECRAMGADMDKETGWW